MLKITHTLAALGCLALHWIVLAKITSAADAIAEQLFVRRIQPLLQEKCWGCHGADAEKREGALELTSLPGIMRGGDSDQPSIVNEDPLQSPLFLAVGRDDRHWSPMPPKEAEKLSQEQLEWMKQWLVAGAPWPDASRQRQLIQEFGQRWSAEDGQQVPTSPGLSPEWNHRKYKSESLWAYQPLNRLPEAKSPDFAYGDNRIDRLIAAALPVGLDVAPPADRRTLIRRATYDLTGLPPATTEVEAFVNDQSATEVAFSKVVERLLQSPHYGEKMSQHWLDVVRYADSSGFANDYERGNAWRYRDYVVRAFNNDKPYNQFVREQIAGDEIDANNPEMLIATGFLRMGPWELTGMEVAKIARQRFLDDVTNSVGECFLAHSLQCARCHDHKFDPIPTRDYYSIQAVFANTQIAERAAEFLPIENIEGFDEQHYLVQKRNQYQADLAELDQILLANAQMWFTERAQPAEKWIAAVQQAHRQSGKRGVFDAARSLLLKEGIAQSEFPPKQVGFTPEQFGRERVARKGLERLAWELERYQPFALSVTNGRTPSVQSVTAPLRIPKERPQPNHSEETFILIGGDPFAPSEKVAPGVLSVLSSAGSLSFDASERDTINDDSADQLKQAPLDSVAHTLDGRRRALADWIVDSNNPLTARVIVNRIWSWHFNEPLAGNPNNFGSTGKRPTHPELLAWLAATFVHDGWSIKSMHRRIMNSDAYRRAAEHPNAEKLARLDPLGTTYARFKPRRLSAEELRDSILVVTGELNRTLGGIPCRPEINREVALQPRQVMGTFAAAWVPNPLPSQRHRRTLYVLKLRGLPDPGLETFNAPSPDFSCERRESSLVAPQAISLFNSVHSHTRASVLASNALKNSSDAGQAIEECFQRVLLRQPTESELTACLKKWQQLEASMPDDTIATFAAAPPPTQVMREAVEENTGERFTFQETLYSNRDFVGDLHSSELTPHTQALADICLALLNSNEFIYLY